MGFSTRALLRTASYATAVQLAVLERLAVPLLFHQCYRIIMPASGHDVPSQERRLKGAVAKSKGKEILS